MNTVPMTMVHIADIHFGCVNPTTELEILTKQFLEPISKISFQILAIDGDLFDRKFSANSLAVMCALEFVNRCAMLCKMRNATLIMISGTESHEAGQLSLFYDLTNTTGAEIYIVEHIQFIHTKGLKILCIPEEYGKGAAYYDNYLKDQYDLCFMHGTLVGGVHGANEENLNASREPIFSIQSFGGCLGPIISGHVHTAMCLNGYMYYLSSPIRYKFGEEAEKGFGILLYNPESRMHYWQFMPITSFRYDTIDAGTLCTEDPNLIIEKLTRMQQEGIDFIRLDCTYLPPHVQAILSRYIHEHKDSNIKLHNLSKDREDTSQISDGSINTTQDVIDSLKGMEFLLDDSIDPATKFVMYMNYNEGSDFISIETLKQILASQ